MMRKVLGAIAIFAIASASSLQAGTVFEFGSSGAAGSFFDLAANNNSGTYLDTASGLSITMTANPGVFNQAAAGGFGVNQAANRNDASFFDFTQNPFDGPGVAEGFTFSFDIYVELENFVVSSMGSGDSISISVDGVNISSVSGSGTETTSFGSLLVHPNSEITVQTTGGTYGNGWSLESIEATAVPEPTSATLFGIASVGLCLMQGLRRRRCC